MLIRQNIFECRYLCFLYSDTLDGYMDIYSKLTEFIADDASGAPLSAPAPPDLTKDAISLQVLNFYSHRTDMTVLHFTSQLPVVYDEPPFGKSFGDVLADMQSAPYSVNQTVSVQFVGANPRVRKCFFFWLWFNCLTDK